MDYGDIVKRLKYPSIGSTPAIFVNIIHDSTKKKIPFCMLLDSGASHTCIPAKYAGFFGHNNTDKRVKTIEAHGVGGKTTGFEHTLQLEMISPTGNMLSKLISPWKSPKMSVWFLEKMDMEMGIIGRDVISKWQGLRFSPVKIGNKLSWAIEISI